MSHFYMRKSYTFTETDSKLDELKKELQEYIDIQINSRPAIIDPPPYGWHNFDNILRELHDMRSQIDNLYFHINNLKNNKEYDEPTL